MPNEAEQHEPKRTAVLVVHGMGSQRPLDTVRGVLRAVWRESKPENKVWVHPERIGADLDLSVFTTYPTTDTNGRHVDFHELYWAHLLSETRAVAVLLWLFELARKGPHLNERLRYVWWGGAVFLSFLLLSVSLLALQSVEKLAGAILEPESMLFVPIFMAFAVVGAIVYICVKERTYRFLLKTLGGVLLIIVLIVVIGWAKWYFFPPAFTVAQVAIPFRYISIAWLPLIAAAVAARVLMNRQDKKGWGGPLLYAYALSLVGLIVYLPALGYVKGGFWAGLVEAHANGSLPWGLHSEWSAIAAWLIVGIYLIFNAAFLTPYFGDVARYVRDSPANIAGRREIRRYAVKTLEWLHQATQADGSRLYDRIVVVAHSLGTAVAYDMLRVFYGRVCRNLPDVNSASPAIKALVDKLDSGKGTTADGRELIKLIAEKAAPPAGTHPPDPNIWLVTDFVTLGSPLTHVEYLLCNGADTAKLAEDFERRKDEREFPTCPPRVLVPDGMLLYRPDGLVPRYHHGGMFALTRWTNLYFPMYELLFGDAIGGPLKALFGKAIEDVPVHTTGSSIEGHFAHTFYWDVDVQGPTAPHLLALRKAINLADAKSNGLRSDGAMKRR